MLKSLIRLFNKIDLTWIDSVSNIDNSEEYFELLSIFPNIKEIFKDAQEKNRDELQRTITHIFRSYKIFFLMNSGEFSHETLSQDAINTIQGKVLYQHSKNQQIIPLILMYHDIGRYIDNKNHPYQSYNLLSEMDLLKPFGLSYIEELLIKKIIHYHLLIATIYTGESTFYGIYSLFMDPEFIELLLFENIIDRFLDLLEVFTFIDILGYPYTKIFNHYIKYYEKISSQLKEILYLWPKKELALKKAKDYSLEWIEWRVAGALRIFQFVETKPFLTEEFYYNKLKESIREGGNQLFNNLQWDNIKNKYLTYSYKIQMRYSLALLMILAFRSFQRMGLKINTGISYKLILFWVLLSKEVKLRSRNNTKSLWNVYLEGMPHWSKIDQSFIEKLTEDKIKNMIHEATHEFDENKKEFTLYLDLTQIIN
ncbi:MAG: hypothetical protein ACFFDF_13750 [Candidatus Odinarchaeota archaeon]